ncbi:MAG: magnesium/cobalt transporter CorA [Candidatus Atabeyarchaeum deiterrae]
MTELYEKALKGVGLPPGSLVYTGAKKSGKVRITIMHYDQTNLKEKEVKRIEDCFPIKDQPGVTWVNIDGLFKVDIIEKIGIHLGLHPLILEDILNTGERPKIEDLEDYIFIVSKMVYHGKNRNQVIAEHISLVLGPNYVITFQEGIGDVFDKVRERVRAGKGRLRKMGADYLAFGLLDAIVDNYFVVLESIGEKIDYFEDAVLENPSTELLRDIHRLRGQLLFLRKVAWPMREVISSMQRSESELVKEPTQIFLSDVYDHVVQAIDNLETFRDLFTNMMDVYVSSVSNRLNEVMKVLTIIATIFMPLSFIAGLYGMNFRFMPELELTIGYPLILFLMLSVGIVMLLYFRRKKWI